VPKDRSHVLGADLNCSESLCRTDDGLLREAVFKGLRDDLEARPGYPPGARGSKKKLMGEVAGGALMRRCGAAARHPDARAGRPGNSTHLYDQEIVVRPRWRI
jgi:hypothetical protein